MEVLLQLKLLNIENKRNRGDGWNGAHFTVLTCIVVHLNEITILVQSANKMETPLLEVIKKIKSLVEITKRYRRLPLISAGTLVFVRLCAMNTPSPFKTDDCTD